MSALPPIVLQNSIGFCGWSGFEHWSVCGALRKSVWLHYHYTLGRPATPHRGLPPMAAALEAGASDFVMLQELLQIMDGMAVIPGRPGNGLAWNEEAVARYRLA